MPLENSFNDLMARLRAGDQEAAAAVYRLFAQRLIALARSRLSRQLQPKMDPEDVLQSVYKSFFRRQADGEFEVEDWESLWGLLATITLRKCGHRMEHFRAACRDVRRESAPRPAADLSGVSWEAIARDPTPSEAAMLTETLETVMSGLELEQRDMIQLSLQGYTVAEISDRVGYTTRTVQRLLERVRRQLQKLRTEEEKPA
jgi:RNA polymerase sigma-70 factor (ECF subfamily)